MPYTWTPEFTSREQVPANAWTWGKVKPSVVPIKGVQPLKGHMFDGMVIGTRSQGNCAHYTEVFSTYGRAKTELIKKLEADLAEIEGQCEALISLSDRLSEALDDVRSRTSWKGKQRHEHHTR